MKKTIFFLLGLCSLNAFSFGLSKGTVVTLADGIEISIEEVKEGDLLLTLDIESFTIHVSKVKSINHSTLNQMQIATLANGASLTLSSDYPILSDKGWASYQSVETKKNNNYVAKTVYDYKTDSFIYSINEEFNVTLLPIIEISELKDNTEIYTLELDNENAAFIANGIFVGQ